MATGSDVIMTSHIEQLRAETVTAGGIQFMSTGFIPTTHAVEIASVPHC